MPGGRWPTARPGGLLSPDPGPATPDRSPDPDPAVSLLDRFDDAADRLFDRVRGHPAIDTTAAVVSNLADYGAVWVALAAVKGRRRGPERARARRRLALAGFASSAVNGAVKRTVARSRPDRSDRAAGDLVSVRAPRSTSFPSGHTLAAFCTAVVLADDRRERVAYLAFAGAVGASRIHLGDHHASDVVGGAAIGIVLGSVVRAVTERE